MWEWQEICLGLGKLGLAAVIGGAIGFERETHGQAAGLRTNILVCVGSCLLMMLSLHMEELFRFLSVDHTVVRLDPGRIASYAIASMGFLGAGAIITGRGSVRGLTTAAGLWLVTGIGLAIGAGYFIPAVSSTVISLVILYGFRRLKPFVHRDEYTVLTLKYRKGDERPLEEVKQLLGRHKIAVQFINYNLDLVSQAVTYRVRLQSKEDRPWSRIIKELGESQGLVELTWEESGVR
jgi:putative Mg2+ transporter-C (MgtC) family protein